MPRNRRRRLTDHDFVGALQSLRLEGLASGRYEPLSDRETFYLKLLRAGRRPDPEDFILSPPLFQLERIQFGPPAEDPPKALTPETRPCPETPALPASSPGPAPDSCAENDRSGR